MVSPLWQLPVLECVLTTRQSSLEVTFILFTGTLNFLSQDQRAYSHTFGDNTIHPQEGSHLHCLSLLPLPAVVNFLEPHHSCESSVPWADTTEGCALVETHMLNSSLTLTLSIGFALKRVWWEQVGLNSTAVWKYVVSFGSFSHHSHTHRNGSPCLPAWHDIVGGFLCPSNTLYSNSYSLIF